MKILMATWLSSAIFQLNLITSFRICKYKLNVIFANTVLFDNTSYIRFVATKILITSSLAIGIVTLFVSLQLNIALCIDLIWIFRYPFAQSNPRAPLAIVVSIVFGIVITFLIMYPVQEYTLFIGMILTSFMIIFYIGVAIFSITFACIKMSSPGVSKQAAGIIWKRHVISTIAFIATNTYNWVNILYMFNKDYRDAHGNMNIDDPWILFFKILFMLQGFLLPATRIVEPYFFQVIAEELSFKKKKV
jgi:hypothetical protein